MTPRRAANGSSSANKELEPFVELEAEGSAHQAPPLPCPLSPYASTYCSLQAPPLHGAAPAPLSPYRAPYCSPPLHRYMAPAPVA